MPSQSKYEILWRIGVDMNYVRENVQEKVDLLLQIFEVWQRWVQWG